MEHTQGLGTASPQTHYPVKFYGKAGDYFGLVFVNGLLKMITLGIYSPWAKVRELQYFYGNTELAGGGFQFTANPLRMLLPRILAFILFVFYMLSDFLFSSVAWMIALGFFIAYIVLSPLLIQQIASFRLRHSLWRGVHFNFNRDYAGAYRAYFAPSLLLIAALALLILPLEYSRQAEEMLGLPSYEDILERWDGEALEEEEEEESSSEAYLQEYDDFGEEYYEEELAEEEYYADDTGEDNYAYDEEYDESAEGAEEAQEEDTYINPFLLIPSILLAAAFMALLPYFDFIHFRYLARNVRFGDVGVGFAAGARDFYRIYMWWALATIALLAMWFMAALLEASGTDGMFVLVTIASVIYFPASAAYFTARRYNLVMGSLRLADRHRLQATLSFPRVLFIRVTNLLAIVVSFGLLRAWARIRLTGYILGQTSLNASGSLDEFLAGRQQHASALADEISDSFDLDMSF